MFLSLALLGLCTFGASFTNNVPDLSCPNFTLMSQATGTNNFDNGNIIGSYFYCPQTFDDDDSMYFYLTSGSDTYLWFELHYLDYSTYGRYDIRFFQDSNLYFEILVSSEYYDEDNFSIPEYTESEYNDDPIFHHRWYSNGQPSAWLRYNFNFEDSQGITDYSKCTFAFKVYSLSENTFNSILPDFSENYQTGYNDGYTQGKNDGNSEGYASGYYQGDRDGYQRGYNAGFNDAFNTDSTAATIFAGIVNVALIPINFFLACLNFEVFGINIGGFVSALLTVCIVVIIVRMITGKKSSGD